MVETVYIYIYNLCYDTINIKSSIINPKNMNEKRKQNIFINDIESYRYKVNRVVT